MLKNSVKVTYSGETKRIQAPASFEELVKATQASFPQLLSDQNSHVQSYKFYLLDEEKELISISSQDDFDDNSDYILVNQENLNVRVTPALIYTDSATDASEQLKVLLEQRALSESSISGLGMPSPMMLALKDSLKAKVDQKLNEQVGDEATDSKGFEKLIESLVKKEVAAYCELNLPRMVREQLSQIQADAAEPNLDKCGAKEECQLLVKEQEEEKKEISSPAKIAPCKNEAASDIVAAYSHDQLSASFVGERQGADLSDAKVIPAGTQFKKSYTMLNDGECSWPADLVFCQRLVKDSIDLKVEPVKATDITEPGQSRSFDVNCTAPQQEGICITEFGLQTADSKWFGQTVRCQIQVPKLEEDKQVEEDLLLANRDKSLGESGFSDVRNKSPRSPRNPYQSMVPQQKPLMTPRQVYTASIQKYAIKDERITTALDRLFEMGFTDFDVNLALMKKYDDFALVAEHICAHGTEGLI